MTSVNRSGALSIANLKAILAPTAASGTAIRISDLRGTAPGFPTTGAVLFSRARGQRVLEPSNRGSAAVVLGAYGMGPWGTVNGFTDASASWIWSHPDAASHTIADPVVLFQVEYVSPSATNVSATLHIIVDNIGVVYVNRTRATFDAIMWGGPGPQLAVTLLPGRNLIDILAVNMGGPGGLIFSCRANSDNAVLFRSSAATLWTTSVPLDLGLQMDVRLAASTLPLTDAFGSQITPSATPPVVVRDPERGLVLRTSSTAGSFLNLPTFAMPVSYTKAAWIRASAAGGNIISSGPAGAVGHYLYFTGSNQFSCGHATDSSTQAYVSDPNPIMLNTWVHYAVTYDNVGTTMVMYRNGEAISTSTNAAMSWSGGPTGTLIGSYQSAHTFDGRLDDVKVYDRSLSAAEVLQLYRNSSMTGGLAASVGAAYSLRNVAPRPPLIYPPAGGAWSRDTADTAGTGGDGKYLYTVSGAPFGNGTYKAWSSNYYVPGNNNAQLAFDRSTGTYWASTISYTTTEAATPVFLHVQLPAAIRVCNYAIRSVLSPWTHQTPSSWDLQGSTNGSTWVSIDRRKAVTGWAALEVRNFPCPGNGAAYAFYRLALYANNSATADAIGVTEFSLYAAPAYGPVVAVRRSQDSGTADLFFNPETPSTLSVASEQGQDYLAWLQDGRSGAYPPASLGATGVVTGQAYGNGTYTVTSSAQMTSPLNSFDKNNATSAVVTTAVYMNAPGDPRVYTGSTATTYNTNQTALGEWIQVQLPFALVPTSMTCAWGHPERAMRTGWFLGSSDGATWTLLLAVWGHQSHSYNFSTAAVATRGLPCTHFRLVINDKTDTGQPTWNYVELAEWSVTGYQQASQGFVTRWYDQSSSANDAVQATAVNQPELRYDPLNRRCALYFAGGDAANASGLFLTSAVNTLALSCQVAPEVNSSSWNTVVCTDLDNFGLRIENNGTYLNQSSSSDFCTASNAVTHVNGRPYTLPASASAPIPFDAWSHVVVTRPLGPAMAMTRIGIPAEGNLVNRSLKGSLAELVLMTSSPGAAEVAKLQANAVRAAPGVSSFPSVAMSDYTATSAADGIFFRASASSELTSTLSAWRVFNFVPPNGDAYTKWQSWDSKYNGTTFLATDNPAFDDGHVDTSYAGQWLQLTASSPLVVSAYDIGGDMVDFRLYGFTASGVTGRGTWVVLDERTGTNAPFSTWAVYPFVTDASLRVPCTKFAVKIRRSSNWGAGFGRCTLTWLRFYGSVLREWPPAEIATGPSWSFDAPTNTYSTTVPGLSYGSGTYRMSTTDAFMPYGAPPGAFDKMPTTGWATFSPFYVSTADASAPPALFLQLPASAPVVRYSLTNSDVANWPVTSPTKWDLSGSMDAASWTVLDVRTGVMDWSASEIKTFDLQSNNPQPFLHYRIRFYRNNSTSANHITVHGVSLFSLDVEPTSRPRGLANGLREWPPNGLATGDTWTKNTGDTVVGLDGTYVKYSTTASGLPYGNGTYKAWANSVYGYSASASFGNDEWPASAAFDKRPAYSFSRAGFASAVNFSNNTVDRAQPVALFLELPTRVSVSRYSLQTRTDGTAQSPTKWDLAGSTDGGSTWTTIDARANVTGWLNGEVKAYDVPGSANQQFALFRLQIYRAQDSGTVVSVSDVRLYSSEAEPLQLLEYPPASVAAGNTWTKELTNPVAGLSGATYCKYSTLISGSPYGNGYYRAWANTIWTYRNDVTYNTQEWPPSAAFDKLSDSNPGWHIASADVVYTNVTDAANPAILCIELPSPVLLKQYSLQCVNYEIAQMPIKWRLEGSTDGSSWAVIESRVDVTGWSLSEVRTFSIASNTTAYSSYRLVLLRNNSSSANAFSLQEWRLFGYPSLINPIQPLLEYPPTGIGAGNTWTKASFNTVAPLSGAVSYCKYSFAVSGSPYGNGTYNAWANSVYYYSNNSSYSVDERPPSGAFDKQGAANGTISGWLLTHSDWNYNNTSDVANPAMLYIQIPAPVMLKQYSIQTRSDGGFDTTAPSKWTLQASLDGSAWGNIHYVGQATLETGWTSNQARTYTLPDNLATYSYYRLVFLRNNSSTNSYVNVAEWRLYGYPGTFTTPVQPSIETSLLEFPPASVGAGTTWTKDIVNTVSGLGGATYAKYVYTVSDSPYGNGTYKVWANTIWGYSASTAYGTSEWSPSSAFDKRVMNNTIMGWHAANEHTGLTGYGVASDSANPAMLYLQLPAAVLVARYSIQASVADAASARDKTPTKWDLQGSNDGTTWVSIDARSGITGWTNSEVRAFNVANNGTAFGIYRIVIYRNTATVHMAVGELRLYGYLLGTTPTLIDAPVLLEYPPAAIGVGSAWTKNVTTDTVTGIGGVTYGTYSFTVTGSSYGNGTYKAWANTIYDFNGTDEWPPCGAFEKQTAASGSKSGWHTADGTYTSSADAAAPPTLYLQLPTAIAVKRYSLQGRGDGSAVQTVSKWQLQGSLDGVTWSLVDAQSEVTNWSSGETKTFEVPGNVVQYMYYRLVAYRNSSASVNAIVVGELRFYAP
jgi:hypothetical protein